MKANNSVLAFNLSKFQVLKITSLVIFYNIFFIVCSIHVFLMYTNPYKEIFIVKWEYSHCWKLDDARIFSKLSSDDS